MSYAAAANPSAKAHWLRIAVTVAHEVAGRAEEALEALGALAITRTDAGNSPQFDGATPGDPRWALQTLTAIFDPHTDIAGCTATLISVIGKTSPVQIDHFADQDWELSGRTQFPPVRISDRLWVCPPWQSAPDPDALSLTITPGLAFGTGTHPTTQLCLVALEKLLLEGRSVLDWGCGSGILAVAALRLGAAHATAVDLDPRALTATQDNAERNGVSHALSVIEAGRLSQTLRSDIVVANILAGTVMALASTLNHHLRPGGTLILSGILAAQADRVRAAFPQYNFDLSRRDDWIVLRGQRALD